MELVGKNHQAEQTPAERLMRMEQLNQDMERPRPYKRPTALYKFRTWEEHDEFVRTRAARRL